jgi:hypothetical protein
MSSCSLSYLGGVFDRAAMILCGSDAVTDPVTGWIIIPTSTLDIYKVFEHIYMLSIDIQQQP